MESKYCKLCGELLYLDENSTWVNFSSIFGKPHKCPPAYNVLDPDWHGDDWEDSMEIYAYSYEEAARKAADKMDSGGDGPNEHSVLVRSQDNPEVIKKFDISFDYSIDYCVNER